MNDELRTGRDPEPKTFDVELAVRTRYSAASRSTESALCCAVSYDARFLDVLPRELIERDYGCGDPARYVAEGETVLDLGSGAGKTCYVAAQIVGESGRVIGVDMNDDMLALARRHREEIAGRLGYDNVVFHKGRIQDLALDLERFEEYLRVHTAADAATWIAAQRHAEQLRRAEPMIADESIDVVISNCVLNLVTPEDRNQLFAELHRVLRPGGRAVISDIVSDRDVPLHLKRDPELWSGCVSGAFTEQGLIQAFEAAGFADVAIIARQEEPWTTVEAIEFRSVTVRANKRGTPTSGQPLSIAKPASECCGKSPCC
jgi:ubiquinone/menaquinone biosynthesis C-methylase UbiE